MWIAVDAMGGDNAPASPVEGAVQVARADGTCVYLVGDEKVVGAEGGVIEIADLLRSGADHWMTDCDLLIIEGAGGLFSPLADGVLNIHLVKQFESAILLIVAENRLGAIHQVLSTCAASIHHGIKPSGIILCDPTGDAGQAAIGNPAQIERYSDVPVLGTIPLGGDLDGAVPLQNLLR